MIGRVWTWIVLKTLLVLTVLCPPGGLYVASAQIRNLRIVPPRSAGSGSDNDAMENVFLPPDRTVLQQLSKAKDLLEEERYGDAVRYLGTILDNPEDFFFQPDKDAPIHRSLKGEAQRLIGSMPKKGLDLYQLRFGAQAKRLLDEAILDGDAERLAEVSRRFFHTHAGYEATFLLGLDHLHKARPLAAALTLQRLRETSREADRFEPALSLAEAAAFQLCGMPEKARDTLWVLKSLQENKAVPIGGKAVPLFAKKNDALDWLAKVAGSLRAVEKEETSRWAMFRGSASRNAASDGGAPLLNMRWRVPVTDDPLVEETLRAQRQQATEQDRPALPGLHPLVVDDVVLMRTVRNLIAVDFASGKRLWEVPVDDPLENLAARQSAEGVFRQQPQFADTSFLRVRDDATYGTLSSDGRLVFSIEDLGNPVNQTQRPNVIIGGQVLRNQGATACNRLAARDIRSGKLQWHVGGPADQFALRLPETFFLGPPLPLLGQLYVLAESKGEGAIVLMALDAKRGDPLWSQPLAVVEQGILEDPLRRTAGASPSYADGVLVCPTSVGAVVAVELATRSLLWGYRYNRADSRSPAAIMRVHSNILATTPWSDSTATIADGKVLLTPLESDSLHCLNLIDGKLLWSYTRQDDLYLACVEGDRVVLVGRRGVKALRLSDGKADWEGRVATFPEGAGPAGRGFLSKSQYLVPLTNATVLTVDLASGKATHAAVSRKGELPGNLVCYKGKVLSQGLEGLDAYHQVDSIRKEVDARLAAKADDAGALSLRGEILLDEGKRAEAVTCFRQAYSVEQDPRTRGLLRDALMDGLKSDFAACRAQAAEIERLLDDDIQRAAFLRTLAHGLQSAGEPAAAFEQYLKLIDLDPAGRTLETVAPKLSVRRDRWIRSQLAALLAEANDPAVRADIERRVTARRDQAVRDSDDESLRAFLGYFGSLSEAASARNELFGRLMRSDRILEAEMLLWGDCQSADASVAGPATARLAELMQKAGRDRDAAACHALLVTRFGDVVCRDGKTGKQLVDSLPTDSPLRANPPPVWPEGLVEVSQPKPKGPRQPSYGRFSVDYDGSPAPFFSDVNVVYDHNQRAVSARDAYGADLWKLTLNDRQLQNTFFNRTMTDGAVHGHLLLMSLGWKILAIDTAGTPAGTPAGKAAGNPAGNPAGNTGGNETGGTGGKAGTRSPKLLWDIDMTAPSSEGPARQAGMQFGFGFGMGNMPNALQQAQFYRMNVRLSGVGPTNHEVVCFQRYRTLTAADPLSGETLWAASNVPTGSELFGDTQYIFAMPPNETEAMVFRAADGQPLGKRKLPRESLGIVQNQGEPLKYQPLSQDCLATFGRQTLLWNRISLKLFDPWEQKHAFAPLTFADNSIATLLGREAVAVCEPSGRFVLVSLPEGRILIDAQLPLEEKLTAIQQLHVERYGDRTLVIVSAPFNRADKKPRNIQPLPGLATQPILRGWAFAFGPDGKPAWPKVVKIANQHLPPNQPSGSPLLAFACQEYIQLSNNSAKNQVLVQCLDKRTGRVVYEDKYDGSTAVFEVVADPKAKTVELRMQQKTVCLTLTDKPVPPEEPKPEGAEAKEPKTGVAEAIFRALGRTARGIVEPAIPDIPGPDDPPEIDAIELEDQPALPEGEMPEDEMPKIQQEDR